MGTPRITMLAVAAVAVLAAACGSDKETVILRETAKSGKHATDQVYHFSGHIYDGTDGTRLRGYTLDLQYKDKTLAAKIDADGRFVVGPIPYFQDYTVRISAPGFRSFMSHNEGIEFEWYDSDGMLRDVFAPEVGMYFNAYLFPESLQVPETKVYVTAYDSDAKLSGSIRVVPTSSPDQATPYSINIWNNDDDRQQRWVTVPLTDGVATIEAGALLFGIQYEVVAFNIPGYQPDWEDFYAGWENVVTLSLYPIDETTPDLVYASVWNDQPSPNGDVFFVFDRPIEFDPRFSRGEYTEFVEAGMSIAQEVGGTNALNDPDDGRGLTMTISDNVLTFSWNAEDGLATVDDDNAITSVTYGNLNQVRLRAVGAAHDMGGTWTTLSNEFGMNTITVDLVP